MSQQSCEHHLDHGQFVDLSKMTGNRRVELFPVLKTKSWRGIHERFFILFRYPADYYGDEVDEDEDFYDGYSDSSKDCRDKWVEWLKKDGITQQVFIDDLGNL